MRRRGPYTRQWFSTGRMVSSYLFTSSRPVFKGKTSKISLDYVFLYWRIFMELMSFVPTKESNSRGRGGSDPHFRLEVGKLRENDTAESLIDTEIPAPKDEWIGRTLDNYKILERVGEGAVGIVYRAEDVRLKRQVAVKLLGNRLLGDRALRKRFLREAQAAASG